MLFEKLIYNRQELEEYFASKGVKGIVVQPLIKSTATNEVKLTMIIESILNRLLYGKNVYINVHIFEQFNDNIITGSIEVVYMKNHEYSDMYYINTRFEILLKVIKEFCTLYNINVNYV